MELELELKLSPNRIDLDSIEEWLIVEENNFKKSFYRNWNVIEKAFNENKLFTLSINNVPKGFIVWRNNEIYADIDIFVIESNSRRKGIGRILFEKFIDHLKSIDLYAIKLFCSPRESEKFWRKMGFLQFPNRGYSESDLTFYKPLIEIESPTETPNNLNKLELWNVEPYRKNYEMPKWTWNLNSNTESLSRPIFQPCNCNWNLRWTKNGKIIRDDKIKYFETIDNQIDFSPFLYITRLTE